MISKIVPMIFNGNWQLIISETLSCTPSQGIQLYVPINTEKTALFKFVFISTTDAEKREVTIDQNDNILTFTLTNFVHQLGASLTDPFKFKIGKEHFLLQLYGISSGTDFLCLTISIFRETHD